jgi:PEP-CTERM motif
MRLSTLTIFATTLFALSIPASADVGLYDWCVNVNGDTSTACNFAGSGGGAIDMSGFDTTTEPGANNLGKIVVTLGTGLQSVAVWMDYDVDFSTLGFAQDFGSTGGALSPTQSYDLDTYSNTFTEFSDTANPLSDSNNVGTYDPGDPLVPRDPCCDVTWSLKELAFVDPSLYSGAVFTFTVSTAPPTSGFYLKQTNGVTGDSIYLSDTYAPIPLTGPPPAVPEPASILLLATAALGVLYWNRRSSAARV